MCTYGAYNSFIISVLFFSLSVADTSCLVSCCCYTESFNFTLHLEIYKQNYLHMNKISFYLTGNWHQGVFFSQKSFVKKIVHIDDKFLLLWAVLIGFYSVPANKMKFKPNLLTSRAGYV